MADKKKGSLLVALLGKGKKMSDEESDEPMTEDEESEDMDTEAEDLLRSAFKAIKSGDEEEFIAAMQEFKNC